MPIIKPEKNIKRLSYLVATAFFVILALLVFLLLSILKFQNYQEARSQSSDLLSQWRSIESLSKELLITTDLAGVRAEWNLTKGTFEQSLRNFQANSVTSEIKKDNIKFDNQLTIVVNLWAITKKRLEDSDTRLLDVIGSDLLINKRGIMMAIGEQIANREYSVPLRQLSENLKWVASLSDTTFVTSLTNFVDLIQGEIEIRTHDLRLNTIVMGIAILIFTGITLSVWIRELRTLNAELRQKVLSVGRHLREREVATDALRESEKQFKGMFENAGVGVARITIDGRFILVNNRFADIVGYDRDALLATSYGDITHPADIEGNRASIELLLSGQMKSYTTDKRYIRADGSIVWTTLTVVVVRDDDGEPEYFIAVIVDITDRKQAEQDLVDSQSRLEEIISIAPEAVITIGSDMKIQSFNFGAERIFGYQSDEVIGRSMEILMPERLRKHHAKHIGGFDRSHDTYKLMDQRAEILGLRKDGAEFPASASVSKLEIGDEKVFTVMLQDVSERMQAELERRDALTEAEKANRAKSEFLAAMSHELRTPLNAILGFADILSNEYLGPIDNKKYVEYANDIHASGDHLLSLVNDILDISSIEAGKMTINKEALSIKDVAKEAMAIIDNNAKTKGIELKIKLPDELPPLYADHRAIRQILLNLLGNSIKFTPTGGCITLSAKALKKHIAISVIDTGEGIPEESLPELTKLFTRLVKDPHKFVEGWGLGLAITKSLVDLHDGELTIKSKLGKGTTVTIKLKQAV